MVTVYQGTLTLHCIFHSSKEYDVDKFLDALEEVLDYDCEEGSIEETEENGKPLFGISYKAFMDVVSETESEEECLKRLGDKRKEIEERITAFSKDIEIVDFKVTNASFKDMDEYNTAVLADSCLHVMDDPEFTESLPYLFFGDDNTTITGMHISEGVAYFTLINDEGDHYNLALKVGIDPNDGKGAGKILRHLDNIYPFGLSNILIVNSKGDQDTDWDDYGNEEKQIFVRMVDLETITEDDEAFYAADTIRCFIDDEYESKIEDEDLY